MADDADEPPQGEVKTGADRLLELVRTSKEIAMSAAAKELGVSVATIEAWANFLEEDGLVTVKYKFTTPYVATPDVPKAKKHAEEEPQDAHEAQQQGPGNHDFKTELDAMRGTLAKAGEEKQSGEFGMLRQTYSSLISTIKGLHDAIIDKAEVSPQKKAKLNDLLAKVEGVMRTAAAEAEQGKFDEANTSYSTLYTLTDEAIKELNSVNEQISALNAIHETKDYKDMVDMAYKLMSEGNVEDAKEIYERLKFARENLAKDFIEKKRQMEGDIAKLDSDLAKSASKVNLERLGRVQQRITALLHAATKFLKKGEFNTAESYYLAIRQEYKSLPQGFAEEKKQLQELILNFYSLLSKEKEGIMSKKLKETLREINPLIKQVQDLLKENRISQATAAYKQLMQIYSRLPEGYLKEKADLQEKIMPLHSALTSLYTSESLNAFKAKAAELVGVLGKMNAHTEKSELKEAEATYRKAKQIYSEMPKGFLHEETILQNQIVKAYEAYLQKAKQLAGNKPLPQTIGLGLLIKQAEDALGKRALPKAREAYMKLIDAYRALPPGDLQKNEAKSKILQLYKELAALGSGHNEPAEPPKPEPKKEVATKTIEDKKPAEAAQIAQPTSIEKEAVETPAEKPETAQPAETDIQTGHQGGGKLDEDIENIEKKIEELKNISKATVKQPFS